MCPASLLDSDHLIDRRAAITAQFPVHLVEDMRSEHNEDGWIALTARLGADIGSGHLMSSSRPAASASPSTTGPEDRRTVPAPLWHALKGANW